MNYIIRVFEWLHDWFLITWVVSLDCLLVFDKRKALIYLNLIDNCRHFDSEASLDLSSAFQSLQDVKTMQMDGKEVVVIDAELYSQVLEELATLKYKLSQLTDLIQLQSISGDDHSEVTLVDNASIYFFCVSYSISGVLVLLSKRRLL